MVLAALVLVVVQQGGDEADQGQGDAEEADEADEGLAAWHFRWLFMMFTRFIYRII